jgi:hypothetical protein
LVDGERHAVSFAHHPPGHHSTDFKLLTDGDRILIVALEPEHGTAGHDAQVGQSGKRVAIPVATASSASRTSGPLAIHCSSVGELT